MAQRELDLTAKPSAKAADEWQTLAAKLLGVASEGVPARTAWGGIGLTALGTRRDWPAQDGSGVPGASPFTRGTSDQRRERWDIRAYHTSIDATAIRDDITGGASSLWFALAEQVDRRALHAALADIPSELGIAFDSGSMASDSDLQFAQRAYFFNHDAFANHARGCDQQGDMQMAMHGELAKQLARSGSRAIGIDSRPYHNAGATPAQEIGIAIASGLAYLRSLASVGLSLTESAQQIAFILVTDADLLLSVAKPRAFRRAWASVLVECGDGAAVKGTHITAVTSQRMLTRHDAHTNILRCATASVAGAIGGADAICTLPFSARLEKSDTDARRIARNTQLILLEEAHLGHVIDPAGGAFAVERLTEDLALAAWAEFQAIEQLGGIGPALASGAIAERIGKAWAERRRGIAARHAWITGLSDFPQLAEILPAPTESCGRTLLPIHFLDEDFELLRARSDAHLAETEERPTIFLAAIGEEIDYAARAGLARSLFASGGIDVALQAFGDATAAANAFLESGLRVAAIASSDTLYGRSALAFAHEIKQTGARYVFLVGEPGALETKLLEAGVDEFVRDGTDAIALLNRAQTMLGLS